MKKRMRFKTVDFDEKWPEYKTKGQSLFFVILEDSATEKKKRTLENGEETIKARHGNLKS